MSHQSRVRDWLEEHGAALDELRLREIRLAVAVDDLRRAMPARHADNQDLVREVDAAAASLADLAAAGLTFPKLPHLRGEPFFRAACRRWLDVAERVHASDGRLTSPDLDLAAVDLVTGREELRQATEMMTRAAGGDAE